MMAFLRVSHSAGFACGSFVFCGSWCVFGVLCRVRWLRSEATRATVERATGASGRRGAQKEAHKETRRFRRRSRSATHHELTLDGKSLKYTATAGTLLIRDEEDKPYGSIFYVAYTLDGAEPRRGR